MNLVSGGLIEIEDYNELALEVNRLFSDNFGVLTWSTSDLVLDYTVTGSPLTAGTFVPFDQANLDLDPSGFIVVIVDDGSGWKTLKVTADYTINYVTNPERITFTTTYPVNTEIRIYYRENHRFGWGQQASVYPISAGDPVLADEEVLQAYLEANVNNLIDKVNVMEERIAGPTELSRVNVGQLIYASDKTTIQSAIDTDILSGDNYWKNEVATIVSNEFSFLRTTPWTTRLTATARWSWESYDEMRYFFNSGCEIRATLVTSGDDLNQGYVNWNQVANDMGTLVLNYNTCFQTGINGVTEDFGAYHLTEDFQPVYTSGSPSVPVDEEGNFDAYADYNDLVIVWQARIVEDAPNAGNISLDIQAVLDDRSFSQTFKGNIEYQAGYTLADDINDNTVEFSITDYVPDITQQEDFTASGTTPAAGDEVAVISNAGFSDGQDVGNEFTIDSGNIIVRFDPTIFGNSGTVTYDDTSTIFVDSGEPFSTTGSLAMIGNGNGDTLVMKVTFEPEFDINVSTEVQNAQFRVSDIDGSHKITVTAYDAAGNEVSANFTPGSNLDVSGNTISSTSGGVSPAAASNSVLVEVPGPTSRIEIVFSNDGTGGHGIYMSDVAFEYIVI